MWGTKRLETAEKWAQRVQLVYLTRIERHGVGGGHETISCLGSETSFGVCSRDTEKCRAGEAGKGLQEYH